jgi:Icc-related predicted phosphoesterase
MLKIVALSDTHTYHRDVILPEGDVLVFAGDLMSSGYKHSEIKDFADWWDSLKFPYKILVAGNHDRMFESNETYCLSKFNSNTHYLRDAVVTIDGVKFWGSPVQPWFYDWAFNVHRGASIKKYWDMIPNDTDVLITHGPPYGYGDQSWPEPVQYNNSRVLRPASEHFGCEELIKAVERIKPKVHIFGHIHGGYGKSGLTEYEQKSLMLPYNGIPTKFYNVAICDEQYNPVNPATVIDIER